MTNRDQQLYDLVTAELKDYEVLLWYTTFIGQRVAILSQLKTHLEAGNPALRQGQDRVLTAEESTVVFGDVQLLGPDDTDGSGPTKLVPTRE